MIKLNKKILVVMGSTILVLGLMAIPVMAETNAPGNGNFFSRMHSYMNKTFTPDQQQQMMNSQAMQDLHNSQAMQDAMRQGDVNKMHNLMNSDPKLEAEIGQDTIDKMNDMMNQIQKDGGMTSIHSQTSSNIMGAGKGMMNY